MSVQKHPWCRDVSRDEAIRRAEDAASAERTPLPDHRDLPQAVAELRDMVARLEAGQITKSVLGSSAESLENKGDAMPAIDPGPGWRLLADDELIAEGDEWLAAPAHLGNWRPTAAVPGPGVTPKNMHEVYRRRLDAKGTQPADGLRTERVTLEVTTGSTVHPSQWPWEHIIRVVSYHDLGVNIRGCAPGESARVVEEAHFDDLAQVVMERDAAIRERDAAKEECERRLTMCESMKRERDAAQFNVSCLTARVAELERAAVRPMGWIARHEQSPPVGKYVMCRWDVSARQGYAREVGYGVAKRGFDNMWRAPSGVEKIAPTHWMPLVPGVEGGDSWEAPPVAAPAANAGGEVQDG